MRNYACKHIDANIRNDIERWSPYPVGFNYRINVVKMTILPRLSIYLFQSLPMNNNDDKLTSRCIWQSKRPRVHYTPQLPKDKGTSKSTMYEYIARWKDIEIAASSRFKQVFVGKGRFPAI